MERLKKILNPLYLLAIGLAFFLLKYSQDHTSTADLFFGFAENKETEINLDYPVKVDHILVKPGDYITENTQLAKLTQITLSKEIKDEQLRINELATEFENIKNELEGEIKVLESEKEKEINQIETKMKILKAEYSHQEYIKDDLKTIEIAPDESVNQIQESEMKSLVANAKSVKESYNTKIESKRQKIEDQRKRYYAAVERHDSDVNFAEEKLKKLDLASPSDALVGNVHVREGEYIESFKTMITLYEPNPTSVAGFVHESMIVNVKVGDKFDVKSSQNPDLTCEGVVTGLGSRIVEIPERLRKIPELKTYGREVLISIPANNKFLQKEKVIIYFKNSDKDENVSTAQNSE